MARMSPSCKPFWDWGFSSVGRMFAWHKEPISVIEAVIFVDIKSIILFSCPLQIYKLDLFPDSGFWFSVTYSVSPKNFEYPVCGAGWVWLSEGEFVLSWDPNHSGIWSSWLSGNNTHRVRGKWRRKCLEMCKQNSMLPREKTPPQRKNSRER